MTKVFNAIIILIFSFALLICIKGQCKTINVLIIDKGIELSHSEIKSHVNQKNWSAAAYNSKYPHGTHIAGLILKNTCKEIELQSCIYETDFNKCLQFAIKINPNVINISAGGPGSYDEEFKLLKQLSDNNVKIVVAAGNDHKNLLFPGNEYYPAKYELKNIIPVGSLDYRGEIAKSSNYGLPNEVWEIGTSVLSTLPNKKWGYMSGTSQATGIRTNRILLEMCKKL
jgi:subtilisin family serine protease